YVLNNARVLQLPDGRLLAPVARHDWKPGGGWNGAGVISCFYSDDAGKTWKHGAEAKLKAEHKSVILQEPGLVLTADGKLLIFCRTNGGFQFGSYSPDRGETWGEIAPLKLPAPVSPATM